MKLARAAGRAPPSRSDTGWRDDTPPYDDTQTSAPTSVEAQDRFLDLLTAAGCGSAAGPSRSPPQKSALCTDAGSSLPGLCADPGDARARPLGHRSTAVSGPHQRTVLVGAHAGVGRELRPPLGRVLPLLPPPVGGHVEPPARGTHHLVAPAGRPVGQVDLVLPPQVAGDPAGDAHGGAVAAGAGAP